MTQESLIYVGGFLMENLLKAHGKPSSFCEKHGIQKLYSSTIDNPLSGRIICGKCGRAYERKVWNSTDEGLRKIIWKCNLKKVK